MKKIVLIILIFLHVSLYTKEQILYKANDKDNPLAIWNLPITTYWSELSEKILKDYKDIKLTPHQQAMLFLKYTEDYSIGYPKQGANPKYVIEEQIGSCGTFTNVFLALMKVNGFNGRVVGLYNYPKDTGHSVAEVFYNDKWHLYDTTYSSYFTTTPSDIIHPNVLAFKEVKKSNSENTTIYIANIKRYYKYANLAKQYVSFNMYKLSNPSGPIGMKNNMIFPITMDFKTKRVITKKDFGPKNQGASYIGVAGVNQSHRYILNNLKSNKNYILSLTPKFIGGHKDLDRFDLYISSEHCIIQNKTITYLANSKKTIQINFNTANEEMCIIDIYHKLSGDYMKYLSLNKIELKEKGKDK